VGKYGDKCDYNCPTGCGTSTCDFKTGKCSGIDESDVLSIFLKGLCYSWPYNYVFCL